MTFGSELGFKKVGCKEPFKVLFMRQGEIQVFLKILFFFGKGDNFSKKSVCPFPNTLFKLVKCDHYAQTRISADKRTQPTGRWADRGKGQYHKHMHNVCHQAAKGSGASFKGT